MGNAQLSRAADVVSLEQLVKTIREEGLLERKHQQERLERFLRERNRQRQLLDEISAQLSREQARADQLRAQFEANEARLSEMERKWHQQAGDMEELFAQASQNATAIGSLLEGSLVNVQKPGRLALLERLSETNHQPTLEELRRLWHLLLDEIAESGRVVRFEAPVILPSGEEQSSEVTRVGVFNAFSRGNYLRYIDGGGKLLEPAQQPASRYRELAADLEKADAGWLPVALDPSRGALLAMMIQSPDWRERLRQGGVIGYFILVLGGIGLVVALARYLLLLRAEHKIQRQKATDEALSSNPLGRLRLALASREAAGEEALAMYLDELTQHETQRLYRGLPVLSLFATVTPLLGLLGTVTGMIETFDAIALFGTGDPKLMSGGISQALVTTQLGLAVAIPLLLIQSFLRGRAERAAAAITQESAELFERYSEGNHHGVA
ncbi:MAG: MotA/TolQ/ExbB proton channel family protein [Methylohalobius sp. ZOD2]